MLRINVRFAPTRSKNSSTNPLAANVTGHAECQSFIVAHEKADQGGWGIVLEDLDTVGFDQRREQVGSHEIRSCLAWLANFHATFFNAVGDGLWPVGTYWHLATRQEELAAMQAGALKTAAGKIDQRLNAARYQTLVHGDAKLANFCFFQD